MQGMHLPKYDMSVVYAVSFVFLNIKGDVLGHKMKAQKRFFVFTQ